MIWKVVPEAGWWLGEAALLWMLFGRARRGRDAKVRNDGKIKFTPNEVAYVAWPAVAGIVAWFTVRHLVHAQAGFFELWIAICFALMTFAILTMFPGAIIVGAEGLEQTYWLWKNKRISWKEIVEINTGRKERTITIVAADGTNIVHSNRLPDRPRLLLELKQHCSESLPPDFPAE